MTDHRFVLTKKQTEKLEQVMDVFYARSCDSKAITGQFLLILGGIRHAVKEKQGLDQWQIDVIVWVLDVLFKQMGEDEYDPLLEQVYHKLTGWWPVEPPWYVRVRDE